MDNINFSAICRTCLHTEALNPIFDNEVNSTDYSEIVYIATGIKVKMDDGLPQNICMNCLDIIKHTMDFRIQCKEAETKLLAIKDKFENINYDVEVKTDIVKMEIVPENYTNKNIKKLGRIPVTESTQIKEEDKHTTEDDDDKPLKYITSNENFRNDKSFNNIKQVKDEIEVTETSVQKSVDKIKSTICQLCDKEVLIHNFRTHMTTCHNDTGERRVMCELCNNFVMKEHLNKHKELMHSTIQMSNNNIKNDVQNFFKHPIKTEIGITEEEFDTTDILYEFDNADTDTKRVTCKLCQKNLSIRSVDAHMAKSHPGADKRRVKCDLCDNVVMKNKLNRHKIMMHGSESFKCRYCQWEFDEKETLLNHISVCSAKKKRRICESSRELRQCDICYKTMQKASLRVHKAIKHAGLRPVCEHCGKNFGNKFRLHEHYRAKHGYEKFKCSFCEFQSASTMAMKNHERRHRGEKPFVCETCGAKFHAAYLLAQHKHSHATDKQFQCDICPSSFKANNSLHMHKRTCHGTAKYACAVCARAYSCRSYAIKHMRTVHRYSGPVPPLVTTE